MELYLHSPSTPSWRGAQGTGTALPLPSELNGIKNVQLMAFIYVLWAT